MDVASIRAIAENLGYCESIHHSSEGILIFQDAEREKVVSIWYHCGTVGVILPHPRRERVTSFFFNVDERMLHQILSYPYTNEVMGYWGLTPIELGTEVESEESALRKQIEILEVEEKDIVKEKATIQNRLKQLPRSTAKRLISSGDAPLSELEKKKRELTDEIKFLEKQKTKNEEELQQVLNQKKQIQEEHFARDEMAPNIQTNKLRSQATLMKHSEARGALDESNESSKGEDEDDETAKGFKSAKSTYLNRSVSSVQRDSTGRYKGNRCLYSLSNEEYQEEFATAWGEKPVNVVALSRGYIIIYEDGGVAWWDCPIGLDQKLRDEETRLPPIKFCALGPEDHYFIKFVNGKMEWVAKDSFQRSIRHGIEDNGLYVDKVSLGPNGSWTISWSNGITEHEGIPPDLAAVIEDANENGPNVREVNLGPSGEWFAILSDNSVQANNLPDALHKTLSKIKTDGGRVRSIVFGNNSSFYVRYWDGLS